MIKDILAKDLEGKEFSIKLASPQWERAEEKHRPEILIASFQSFGLGSRLRFEEVPEEEGTEIQFEEMLMSKGDAIVTKVENIDGKIIIEAEKKSDDDSKKELVDKIVKKIDFDNALSKELFVKMLSSVFTERRLKEFLNEDDLEILVFKGLMYLKSKDKAYRL